MSIILIGIHKSLFVFFLAYMKTNICVCRPKLYAWFADDCFATFNNNSSFLDFLSLLNSQHKNIKFTIKSALQGILYLDVHIKVSNDNIDTWIWRKPTHSGLFLNYNANCPKKMEIRINTLLII